MHNPYFALTAIYDSTGWINTPHPKEEVKERYYNSKQIWRAFIPAQMTLKEIRTLLDKEYGIYDVATFQQYMHKYLQDFIAVESLHASTIAHLHAEQPITITSEIANSHYHGYIALAQIVANHWHYPALKQISFKEEIDGIWYTLGEDQAYCDHLQYFLGHYEPLWANPTLQVNQHGVYVGFSGYYFIHMIELLALADQVGLLESVYLKKNVELMEQLLRYHFPDWQTFWSSYVLGLFFHTYQEDILLYPLSIERFKGLLFHNLYPLLDVPHSPFFTIELEQKTSFDLLKSVLEQYAQVIKLEKPLVYHAWQVKESESREDVLIKMINQYILSYYKELYYLLKSDDLHSILFTHNSEIRNSIYQHIRSHEYQQAPFWQLADEYGLLAHSGEIPLWLGSNYTLISNYGIYFKGSLWHHTPYFLAWHPSLHFRVRHQKQAVILYVKGHKVVEFTRLPAHHHDTLDAYQDRVLRFAHKINEALYKKRLSDLR